MNTHHNTSNGVVFTRSVTDLASLNQPQHDTEPFTHRILRIVKTAFRAFAITYGVRAAISLTIRIIYLLRTRPKTLLSLTQMLSEENLKARVPAVRLGLFAGVFVGVFEGARLVLGRQRRLTTLAGFMAGIASILFIEQSDRKMIALYGLARLTSCVYNTLKERGIVSPVPNGDAYAYVMRPETLNPGFWKFIVKTGPIHPTMLEAIRQRNRGEAVNVDKVNALMQDYYKVSNRLEDPCTNLISCSEFLHPLCPSCLMNIVRVALRTAWVIFPQYSALTFIPLFVVRFNKLLQQPIDVLRYGFLSTLRSTAFISLFVASYQGFSCWARRLVAAEHRGVFFLAGIVSSLSVFVERKSKRSELALYTLPRGLDSFIQLLVDRNVMITVPFADVWLFGTAAGGLMYFFHHEPGHLEWFLKALFKFTLKYDS